MYHITEEEFISSLGIRQVLGSFLIGDLGGLSELVSEGKSGSFFYFSSDLKFLVKTITMTEMKTFSKILKDYYAYLEGNPNTLLTSICGLYNLEIGEIQSRFIVMLNCFPPSMQIHKRFDLKGSTIGRTVGDHINKPGIILKDVDLVKMGYKIRVSPQHAQLLAKQIEQDSLFLENHGIIDYSLLIGIHELEKKEAKAEVTRRKSRLSKVFSKKIDERKKKIVEENSKASKEPIIQTPGVRSSVFHTDEGGMYSHNVIDGEIYRNEIIYIGIIDILIEYEISKQAEHHLKSIVYDKTKISVCPPSEYGPRFRNFITEIIEIPANDESK